MYSVFWRGKREGVKLNFAEYGMLATQENVKNETWKLVFKVTFRFQTHPIKIQKNVNYYFSNEKKLKTMIVEIIFLITKAHIIVVIQKFQKSKWKYCTYQKPKTFFPNLSFKDQWNNLHKSQHFSSNRLKMSHSLIHSKIRWAKYFSSLM